jgi:hypothetical protein
VETNVCPWVGLFKIPSVDLQDMIYYSAKNRKLKDLSGGPELLRTFEKLGISLTEQNDYQTSQLMQYLMCSITTYQELSKYG